MPGTVTIARAPEVGGCPTGACARDAAPGARLHHKTANRKYRWIGRLRHAPIKSLVITVLFVSRLPPNHWAVLGLEACSSWPFTAIFAAQIILPSSAIKCQ